MNKLSDRQKHLVENTKEASITVDVGCDHGIIGTTLLKENKTKFLIATDISAPSAKKAKILLEKCGLASRASVRIGDGLKTIKDDEIPDQILIAGMGGKEICHILENYKKICLAKHFVFQPMKELAFFREYLNTHGFKILKDFVFCDKDKFYHLITAKIGKQKLTKSQIYFGKNIECSVDYFLWLNKKQEKLNKILCGLPSQNEKIKKIKSCLKMIERIKSKGEKQ